jgi:hypothetical protein
MPRAVTSRHQVRSETGEPAGGQTAKASGPDPEFVVVNGSALRKRDRARLSD